jgi:hypothetical protein
VKKFTWLPPDLCTYFGNSWDVPYVVVVVVVELIALAVMPVPE